MFGALFGAGWRIKFAHRTFAWDAEAPGKAAVHCVIVGFAKDSDTRPILWGYPDLKGAPVAVPVDRSINAYLFDGANVLVDKASKPISKEVAKTSYGSKPTDGGHLIVEPEDYESVMADPVATKYFYPYVGAKELLHGNERWCLWLEDMEPKDLNRSHSLKERIEAVRNVRLESKAASTRDFAQFPPLVQAASEDGNTVSMYPAPRQRTIDARKKVIAARAQHPERSLADHYNPLAMDPQLAKAHDALDREVDKAFGASKKLTTERQRQELLFENYVKLTASAQHS